MIRAVLLDLDDTLVQETKAREAAARALRSVATNAGSPESERSFLDHWSAATVKHFDRYVRGEISFEQQRRERIREVIDSQLSDTEADRLLEQYVSVYQANWSLFPDVNEFFDRHSALRIAIVTNGQAQQQRAKVRAVGLTDKVHGFVISEEVGASKPAAEIFHSACQAIGVAPTDCLCIGDSLQLDIRGAENAGIPAILIDRQGMHAPLPGVRIAKSLLEVEVNAL